MTKPAFTPGPWLWRGKCGGLYAKGEPPYTYGDAVLVPTWDYDAGTDTKVSDADAALIAAAPDLYAALDGLSDILDTALCNASGFPWYEAHAKKVKAARAALAKARGED